MNGSSVTLDKVEIQIDASAKNATENIEKFTSTLSELKNATKGGFSNLSKLAEGLNDLKTATKGLDNIGEQLSSVSKVTDALQSLSNIPSPRGLSSTVKNLEKLPSAFEKFDTKSLENVGRVSKQIADALTPLADKLGEISRGYSAVNQVADRYGVSVTKIREYTKQSTDYTKMFNRALNGMKGAVKGIGAQTETILKKVAKGSETVVHKLKRIGLALLGTRSVFTATRKAVSEYMALDERLTWERTNAWRALGAQLAPAMEYVIYMFKQFVRVIYSVILALTGIDLISRANAKAMQGWGKAAKDTLGNLQKFDDLNVVEFPKDSGGGWDDGLIKLDAIDLTPIQKIIDWVRKLKAEIENAWDTGKWYGVGKVFAEGINAAIDAINADKLYEKMESIMHKVADGINGFFENLDGANIGKLFEVSFLTIPITLNALLESVNWGIIGVRITEALDNIDFGRIVEEISKVLINWFNGLQTIFLNIDSDSIANAITGVAMGLLNSVVRFFETIKWDAIAIKIHDVLMKIDWKSIWETAGKALKLAFASIGKTIAGILFGADFENDAKAAFSGLGIVLGAVLVGTLGKALIKGISSIMKDVVHSSILSKLGASKASDLGGGLQVPDPKTVVKGLADLAIIVGGLTVLVGAIGALMQWDFAKSALTDGIDLVVKLFKGIGEILLPLSAMAIMMTVMGLGGGVGAGVIATGLADVAIIIGGMGLLMGGIGALSTIKGVNDAVANGIDLVKTMFLKIQEILLPLSVVSALVVGLGLASPLVILSGLVGLGLVIEGFAVVMEKLGELKQKDGFMWLVAEGGDLLVLMASNIGRFAGTLLGSFIDSTLASLGNIGTHLSEFMTNATPFFDGIKGIDESSSKAAKYIAEAILVLTASSIIDNMTKWFTGGANKNILAFGKMLPEFGGYIKQYGESIQGVDAGLIESTSNAVKSIGEFAKLIPYSDGLWSKIAGEKNLSKFGKMLPEFGKYLKQYSDNIKGVDTAFVEKSSGAVEAIMEFAKLVPKSDGLWQKIAGEKNLGAFGKTLASFGESFKKYYDSVKGIQITSINTVTEALGKIVDMYKTIKDNKLDKTVTDFSTALSKSSGTINSFFSNTFSSSKGWNIGYSFGNSLANGITRGMQNASFPTLKMRATNTGEVLQTFRISAYAGGGFVDSGQFFFANENGVPEYIGSMGNRAAVANNVQIVEGIKRGVREAMMEVDVVQPVTVNVGNKTLYKEQQKYNRRQSDKYGTDVYV